MHSIEINLFDSDKFIAHVNKNHNVQSQGYKNLSNASKNWIKMLVESPFWCIRNNKLQHLIKIT